MNTNKSSESNARSIREGAELRDLAATVAYRKAAALFNGDSGFGEVCEYAESHGLRWAALCVAVLA